MTDNTQKLLAAYNVGPNVRNSLIGGVIGATRAGDLTDEERAAFKGRFGFTPGRMVGGLSGAVADAFGRYVGSKAMSFVPGSNKYVNFLKLVGTNAAGVIAAEQLTSQFGHRKIQDMMQRKLGLPRAAGPATQTLELPSEIEVPA